MLDGDEEREREEDKVKFSWALRAGQWVTKGWEGWTPATEGLVSICVSPCESGAEEKAQKQEPTVTVS